MKRRAICVTLMLAMMMSSICACGKSDNIIWETAESDKVVSVEPVVTKNAEGTDNTEVEHEESEEAEEALAPTENVEENKEPDNLVRNADGSVNYLYYYSSVLTRIHYVITYPNTDFEYGENESWLWNAANNASIATNLEKYGYLLEDISGDGIPELLLTDTEGENIYGLYTLDEYKPYFVCDGYFRCRYAYLGDGVLGSFISAAGMYQILGEYKLSENGQQLIPINYYFTSEDASGKEMVSYYNTIGESDIDKSESIENDDFFDAWNKNEERIEAIDCIPYCEKTLEVAYVEDNPNKKIVGNFVTDVTEYAHEVIVFDENGMSDVELLGIKYIDSTENGDLILDSYHIYDMGDANGDEAIAVTITFGENVPDIGIQYKDANGIFRRFAIDVSGKDGSVYLWEF